MPASRAAARGTPRAGARGPALALALAMAALLAAPGGAAPAEADDATASPEIAQGADPAEARARYREEEWQALLAGEVVQRTRTVDAEETDRQHARGAVVVDAPPERVWAILSDHRAWPRIFPNLRELEAVGEGEAGVHLRHVAEVFWMEFTWYTVRSADPAEGHIAVRLDPERPGDLEAAESHWQLVPLEEGGRTLVEFRTRMRVGGVPGWVEERLTKSGLPDQLRALREEVRRRAEEPEDAAETEPG